MRAELSYSAVAVAVAVAAADEDDDDDDYVWQHFGFSYTERCLAFVSAQFRRNIMTCPND